MKKLGILILASTTGTVTGFPVYLLVSLALLVMYGDDGHPSEFLQNLLFYGTFGITTLLGLGVGFLISKRSQKYESYPRNLP